MKLFCRFVAHNYFDYIRHFSLVNNLSSFVCEAFDNLWLLQLPEVIMRNTACGIKHTTSPPTMTEWVTDCCKLTVSHNYTQCWAIIIMIITITIMKIILIMIIIIIIMKWLFYFTIVSPLSSFIVPALLSLFLWSWLQWRLVESKTHLDSSLWKSSGH